MTSALQQRRDTRDPGALDLLAAMRTRRSVGRVRPERPPRAVIEQLLEAASWAPNHHRTAPWRFFVLTDDARKALGTVMARGAARMLDPALPEEQARQLLARTYDKALRAPVIVVVAVEPQPEAVEIEEIAAGAAAIENLLLAAHALGLGAIWRTGTPAYDPEVKAFFDLAPTAHLLGFVYLGWPAGPAPTKGRRPPAPRARWLGWEESER